MALKLRAQAASMGREAQLQAEADRHAIAHPRQAQVIRRARGVPENCDFKPPRAAQAIVSTGPVRVGARPMRCHTLRVRGAKAASVPGLATASKRQRR